MIALLSRPWRWLVDRTSRIADRLTPDVRVTDCEVPPDRLKPRRVYVTHGAEGPAFGFLRCPCGCGETLHLRFFGERRPRWSVEADGRGRASLYPSVWRQTGCRSHFVLRNGRIHWC